MNSFKMIKKDLLFISGENILSIINVNQHNLVRTINSPDSGKIYSFCILNENNLLTRGSKGRIKHWRFEGDDLKLISTKEIAHDKTIYTLLKLKDGNILSGTEEIKIWNFINK